jgi:hypothetical protein
MVELTLQEISEQTIFLLMYADNAVILSESKEGLQESINNLSTYCFKWNLTVNVENNKKNFVY